MGDLRTTMKTTIAATAVSASTPATTISVVEPKSTMNHATSGRISDASQGGSSSAPVPPLATSGSDQVRVVAPAEYKQAALALAEAFVDDHSARYFVETPGSASWTAEQKWDLHRSMLEYITYAHCLKGLVLTVGPSYGAVALW